MINKLSVFLTLGFLSLKTLAQENKNFLFYKDNQISIFVAKKLFENTNSQEVYLNIIITNTSNKKIGLDLTKTIYPHVWSIINVNEPSTIDQLQIIPDQLNKQELLQKFYNQQLQIIESQESFSYLVTFKNLNKNDIKNLKKNQSLFILLSGQLLFTDGKECIAIACTEETKVNCYLSIPYPIEWNTINAIPDTTNLTNYPIKK